MIPLGLSTLGTIVIVLAALFALLAIGGTVAAARRTRSLDEQLMLDLQEADRALAQAHASDKGWERSSLEAAARRIAAERFGETQIDALQLVQVIDRPGTDADQAVFRVATPDGEHRITLGRTNGVWGAA